MSYTEETQVAVEDLSRRDTPRGRLPVRVALATLFLLSSLPLGIFWVVVLVVLVLVGLPLTIVWVGLPILALAIVVCILGANTERWRLAVLLGTRLSSPYRPLPGGSVLAGVRGRATDPALWRGLLYLLLLLPVGLVEFVVIFVMVVSAALATYPLWFWTLREGEGLLWSGVFLADTVPEALLVMLVGLVAATATAAFVLEVARAHAALDRVLLKPPRRERLEERVEVLTESRSKTLEAAIVERRRIERDLHDGAQQRLISLAMGLGMAREARQERRCGYRGRAGAGRRGARGSQACPGRDPRPHPGHTPGGPYGQGPGRGDLRARGPVLRTHFRRRRARRTPAGGRGDYRLLRNRRGPGQRGQALRSF